MLQKWAGGGIIECREQKKAMPIYEYECPKCGHRASFLEDRDAARRRKCPGCGRRTFARVISAAAFRLKGGGWYATDFRDSGKPKPKPKKEAEEKKPPAPNGKPDPKNPPKPEKKGGIGGKLIGGGN